jgi:hypothetical protein
MISIYGADAEERVDDETWLMRAGREEWIVLAKDTRIRRRPAELDAIRRGRLRVFCITTANLTGEQQRDRVLANMNRILQRSRRSGPRIWAIYEDRVEQIWPSRA